MSIFADKVKKLIVMGKGLGRRKCVLFTILTVVVAIALISSYVLFKQLSCSQATWLYVDSDDNLDSVAYKIDKADVGVSILVFNLLATLSGYDEHIRTGKYELSANLSTLTLFRHLRGHVAVPVRLVVPSVRTTEQLAGRLASRLMVDSVALSRVFNDSVTWQSVGRTKETFPALFIPNTYEVYWDISPEDLVRRMYSENKRFWNEERRAKAKEAGLSEDEVVTLASIVDCETANNEEKPRIAGLYINRMNKGLLLQSCPTVIYANGDFSVRRVTEEMLESDSPYNTYKVQGLPPGPIFIPSIAGIDAVLNYEHNDYLYMCAKEDFSGTHNFARTYREHSVNARKYARALNERDIH